MGEPNGSAARGAPRGPREPEGRGVAWTEERGTSDEGRQRLKSAPEASGGEHSERGKRPELAAFLRSRRERITPEDVGLPGGHRRRTAGLRREEVAQLAGVGVTWYTWLEQGRPIRASVQVLDAVARTLRLDPVERQHLFRLAEIPDPAPAGAASQLLSPEIRAILDQLVPMPANVVTERFDILAWNAAYATLFPPPADAVPSNTVSANTGRSERNSLLYCFTQPACCSAIENHADQRAAMVAQLRAAYGRHVGDPAWTGFIRRMEAASPEFAAMWATQDVAQPASHAKVFRHPLFPRLAMTSTSLAVQAAPGARLVVYAPSDDATRRAMEQLVEEYGPGSPQPRFPCWPAHQARALVPEPV
jgi:transcriptional regulator with XRE-family HTH domain